MSANIEIVNRQWKTVAQGARGGCFVGFIPFEPNSDCKNRAKNLFFLKPAYEKPAYCFVRGSTDLVRP
jgi:hypothetical protein